MIEYALLFCALCYGAALLLDLWRIAVGPDADHRNQHRCLKIHRCAAPDIVE